MNSTEDLLALAKCYADPDDAFVIGDTKSSNERRRVSNQFAYEIVRLHKKIDERMKYWICKDLKNGWTTIGPCCDKCRLTNPQGNMARLCGCRDPFQIECQCHLPARKAVKDYMVQELTAILKDSK